jgi:hypothetical protein
MLQEINYRNDCLAWEHVALTINSIGLVTIYLGNVNARGILSNKVLDHSTALLASPYRDRKASWMTNN